MTCLKRASSVFILVLIFGLLSSVAVNAQGERFATFSADKFRVSIAPGWSLYSMQDVNKQYIDRFAKDAGVFDENLSNGPGITGDISYFVTPDVSVSAGITYLRGQLEKKSWEDITDGADTYAMRWERSLTATAIAPQVMAKYHFPLNDLDLYSGAGIGWCWGKVVLKSDSRIPDLSYREIIEDRFTAQGLALTACVGMSHDVTETFAVGTEIGYRHFATGDLETKGGEPWVVDYGGTTHKMKLDFNGAFFLINMSFKL